MESVNKIDGTKVPDSLFEPVEYSADLIEQIARKPKTFAADAWGRFKKNPLAMFGLVTLSIIIIFAIFGPIISSHTYVKQNIENQYQGPSKEHWLGTDKFGRDLFVRIMYGARISLTIGFAAALISISIGIVYGGIAGFFGGNLDVAMMRFVDIIAGIPSLCYVILIMLYVGSSVQSIVLAICISSWTRTARVVRSQILTLREQDFIMAARSIGESNTTIIRRHLVPNCLGPIIVTVSFLVPEAIFTEAYLSFLGIGIRVPMASWGTLANDAISTLNLYPYLMFLPAVAISLTMFSLNFIGDGLRDSLDPKLKNR